MLQRQFRKYSGAGNDFVVLDAWHEPIGLDEKDVEALVRHACARGNGGVGSDGLILIDRSISAPFLMRFYNPDGSYGALCGNGARCAVQAAKDLGVVSEDQTQFEVLGDVNRAELLADELVKVYVQRPKDLKLNFMLRMGHKLFINANYVDVGSQHGVIFIDELQKIDKDVSMEDLRIGYYGPMVRWHVEFAPKGVNANFVEVREDAQGKYLRIRTFERGVEGETLACGTGCISSAIIAHATNKIDATSIRLLTQSSEFVTVGFDMVEGRAQNLSLEGSAKRGMAGVLIFDEEKGSFSYQTS
jgi:diaminopimelate epimerase